MSSPTQPGGLFTESRIGTVVSATPNAVFVDVGGTVLSVPFVVPFLSGTVTPPAAGTVVQLIRQDASWVCLGRLIGAGSNSVLNPSFEDSAPGTQPVNWTLYDVSGISSAVVFDVVGAPDGDLVVRVFSGQTSVSFLYSNPIPVTAGDIWSVAASVGGDYGALAPTADASLVALWFANATNLYPTTSSANIVITSTVDVPQAPPYRSLFGNVTAPVTGFMRVALQSNLTAGQALLWDAVSARRA